MANKKINQLVSKTSILSTDLFGIGDATTGQLFKKTIAELQAAIGGAVISVNGLVGTVVLDTDDIQELATPTNKYFTDARARGAISLTVTGNSGASTYSSGTGVLNVPTYTLAGLGGITASFLSGTSGISYNSTTGVITYSGTVYTDSSIRALLSGSTGISYNSTTGAISYSGTVYTDSSVRALISLTTTGTSGASTYNNTTGVINVPNYTLAGLGGISLTSLSGGTGITYNNTTGAISYSGTVYTDASVRALISATGNISYNSTTGVISTSLTQYTDALARASISLTTTGTSGASTYNSTTGVFNIPQYQAVLTNPVTGTGTTNYHTKWTSSSAIGDSLIYDNGSKISIGTTSPEGLVTIKGTSAQPPTSGTTANSLLQLVGSLGNELNIGSNTVTGGYGSYIQASDNNLAVPYPLNLQPIGGNVGIGTDSPTRLLDVSAAGTAYIRASDRTNSVNVDMLAASSGGWIGTQSNHSFQLQTNNTERMRITSSGQIILGDTSIAYTNAQGYNLGIKSASTSQTFLSIARSGQTLGSQGINIGLDTGQAYFFVNDNIDTVFRNNAVESLRIFANRNIAIGTATDNGYKLYVSGTIYATGNITANSDLTLKKNLTIIDNPTDKLMQLNGYAYQWKSDDSHQYGVIAQEVEKILPYAVSTGNDGIKGVSYNQIIPVLIEAVKEQKKELEELRNILASK